MRFRNAIEFAVPSSTKLFHVTNHDQFDPYSSIRSGSGIVPTSDVAISFLSPPSASSALYVALNGYRMRQRVSLCLSQGHTHTMVARGRWIRVVCEHVDRGIARVPVGCHRVPDPDQVVEFVVVGEAVIHQVPESLARRGALRTPPEPSTWHAMSAGVANGEWRRYIRTLGLVQWPP